MDIEKIREHCLAKPHVSEGFPFNDDTLVFKVMNKIFALCNLKGDLRVNLKNQPEKVSRLRDQYSCVQPGYHMNKNHWNTVIIDNSVPDRQILEWIDESYLSVVKGLPKKVKEKLPQTIQQKFNQNTTL